MINLRLVLFSKDYWIKFTQISVLFYDVKQDVGYHMSGAHNKTGAKGLKWNKCVLLKEKQKENVEEIKFKLYSTRAIIVILACIFNWFII